MSLCSHSLNMPLQQLLVWKKLSCCMMSSVLLGRPSCVPITLHCTAYCGVKCWCRSLSDGVVFTKDLKNYKLFKMYFRIPNY